MLRVLKSRAGFTLAEVLVALVLTAVIGAAVTGAFVSQSAFFDQQEKVSFARGVSRGAVNMMMSELRMIERTGGIPTATVPTNSRLTVRVPYAMGIVCGNSGSVTIMRLPADPSMQTTVGFGGYAWRTPAGVYTYVEGGSAPTSGTASVCTGASINTSGFVSTAILSLTPTAAATVGQPVLLYRIVTYEFKSSAAVPGRVGLFRDVQGDGIAAEELVAPFDTTAKFRFFVNDAASAQTAVPSTVSDITGIELTLDGISERPESNGTFRSVPFRTSVFFRNRIN
jgi:prepilin-type N-terminal cleavage/methylation domain-containing protein